LASPWELVVVASRMRMTELAGIILSARIFFNNHIANM